MGNVTCIHYKNKQERRELIKMCNRFKTGTYGIGGLVSSLPSHSKVTMDISEIFEIDPADQTEGSNRIKPPKLILIEGAPGIGKTILAREIAYLWANQKLLKDYKLVILVYLRDPRVHTMKSVEELIQLYTNKKVADEVSNYLEKFDGQNVVFIFDGFDEFPISQEKSIVTDIIGISSDNVRKFCKSTVVVTSRLSTTLILHKIVDSRIEILGFAPKEFGELASQSVLQFPGQREEFENFFKKHPIIIDLCYSPLNLSIILYLFHQGNLPKTLTEVNEYIIVHMVYRHIMKTESPFSLAWRTDHLKDMPKNIYQVLHKLSKLAFDGLRNDQFVFTHDKLKDVCPEIFDLPEAANGFSLLQAMQLYSQKKATTTMKFNFLNLIMQEYLAAYYVSTLPEKQQLGLLQTTFWDDRFNFMWKMYVGIVGVESVSFASFLRMKDTQTITVKSGPRSRHHIDIIKQIKNLRYLHLFLCYMEAKANAKMPQEISTIFNDGTVNFMDITLHSHHIISLLVFMFVYSTQQWKSFTLNKCNLQRTEMNILLYNISNNKERMLTLKYVDLNENGSSPWGIYSVIIRHSSVNSLELCGDEGMNKYINEVTDSLQANETIQSLSLFSIAIGKVGVESIKMVLMNNLSLKRLTLSWQTKHSEYGANFEEIQIHTPFSPNTDDAMHIRTKLNDYNKVVNVYPSYDVYICYQCFHNRFFRTTLPWDQEDDQLEPIYLKFPGEISIPDDERINDDKVHVLLFGLCNNKTIEQLNLSNNSIADDGAVAIIECLKHNNTIKKLDLSYNRITVNGMNKMLESIKKQETTLSLEYVDLSENGMSSNGITIRHHSSTPSPWGVYCAIIRHCCSDSLTLCGDNGIKEYIKEITDNLQTNTTLQSLTLFDIKTVGVQSVKAVLMNKSQFTLKALNLSLHKVNSKTLQDYMLLHKLSHNTDVAIQNRKERDLRGIRNVTLKYNIKVNQKSLFLSFAGDVNNETFFEPKSIDLSVRQISDDELSLLTFGLCDNTLALEEVNISDNFIEDEGAMAIIDLLKNIKSLKKLDLSKNMIEVNGMNEILRYIENQGTSSLEYVDLSKNRKSPWGVYCAIIRHCRVSHLTLCGDDDMDRYLFREEIIKSMDVNTRLHLLTICDVDEKIYETFKYHCSERFNERLLQSQMWRDIEFAKPYKKLRCYSLSSSDVINGKITLVVSISERNDDDRLLNICDQ